MVSLTITALLQVIAVLTIPAIIGFIAWTQMNTKSKFQWKQGRIALVLSMVPVILIFGLQGLLAPWMVMLSLAALGGVALLINMGDD